MLHYGDTLAIMYTELSFKRRKDYEKLHIELRNKENNRIAGHDILPLDELGETFITTTTLGKETLCYKIRVDKGYVWTEMYYPVDKFEIFLVESAE